MINKSNKAYNILIIDDFPNNIKVAANILQQEGYKLFFAKSGKKALAKMKSSRFDLILLDVMMPEMNGFEVCQRIRNDPDTKDIPIIFLTAKTDTKSIVKGFEVGAMDYVSKPFNGAELLARVKTHLALRRAQEELQELNASKDKFFSILAHDLRGPLGTLHNLTQIIVENIKRYNKDRLIKVLMAQRDAAKNLLNLLENLLTWSRIQREMIECCPQYIGLEEIIARNIDLLTLNAQQKQVMLNNSVEEKTTVYADPNMIDTVIRNLLSNALKFTDSGGNIEISTTHTTQYVEISISDTGIGISEKLLPKLFRIDTLSYRPGTADEKGTGLGLILCKDLIEKNGGRIWIVSEIGKGSVFRFTLPREPVEWMECKIHE